MPFKAPVYRPKGRKPPREDRPSSCKRGYDATWRKLRLIVLARKPVCEGCGRVSATEVDHIVALEKGGTNDEGNLRAYCKRCHSAKTCREDNGLGRKRRAV